MRYAIAQIGFNRPEIDTVSTYNQSVAPCPT